ncbi:MAG: DUF1735 and LamG domain-containing protein [Prevotella sp.]|jgi:hypothetical protein|nr:DUF1735 and LamG domain-containing protein [Prevotella sp.]
MKRYNLYLLPALFSLILFDSCRDEDSFENKAYMDSASKVSTLLIKANIVNEERTLQVAIAKPEDQDVTLTYKADPSLTGTYNEAYYDNAAVLRAEFYELPRPEVTITAGSVRSTETTVYFKGVNKLNRDSVYVLPVTIANANIDILESARTHYYVFRGAALINVVADMEDNYLHINQWTNPGVVNDLPQVTMEALIRCRNFDRPISTVMGIEGRFLIRIGDAGFPSNQIQIATSNGNFPDADSNKGLPVNEWIHIALTYDSSNNGAMKVYVNGKVQSESAKSLGRINLGINGSNGFYIGRSYEDSRFLAGEVSECRIWNIVRTQEEIAGNPYEVDPASEGLVAYWKCDDGSGNTVKDHTVNGNHLTSKKDIKWTPVSLPPKD